MSTRRSPVLRLVVLGPEPREPSERVFCRRRGESLTLSDCRQCEAWVGDAEDAVVCVSPPEPPPEDPEGERTAVGSVLCRGATVLADGTTLDEARLLLQDGSTAAVVDESGRVIGTVDASALTGPWLDLARIHASCTITESTPVRGALRLLASAHLREATIVTSDGEPIGIFRDVDGLFWLARARRTGQDHE